MIKFSSLVSIDLFYRIPGKIKYAIYRLEISALVVEIFKFEKWVNFANKITDDVIHSTQYKIKYINRAISVNFQKRPLKLGRRIVIQTTHLWPKKNWFPWQLTFFLIPFNLIQYFWESEARKHLARQQARPNL